MPLWKLKYMDYCEKQNLFIANGMGEIANLHDVLSKMKINFHISDWHLSDEENYLAAEKAIEKGKNFLFIYTASLDALLHDKVADREAVNAKLIQIREKIESLYTKAESFAGEVHFTIISDHGMTPLAGTADIMSELKKNDLIFGKDYGACFDSTMARFYYLAEKAEPVITGLMKKFPGRFLTEAEEKNYGIYRKDRAFGDAIFLLDPGIQIVPSDMGEKALNGMHGFTPENEYSFAAILSNTVLPQNVEKVADYFNLMIERAEKL